MARGDREAGGGEAVAGDHDALAVAEGEHRRALGDLVWEAAALEAREGPEVRAQVRELQGEQLREAGPLVARGEKHRVAPLPLGVHGPPTRLRAARSS